MIRPITLLLLLLTASALRGSPDDSRPIQTTADLRAFRAGESPEIRTLDITAHVTRAKRKTIILEDETGRAELTYLHGDVAPGDLVRIQGSTSLNESLIPWDHLTHAEILGRRTLDDPVAIPLDQLDFKQHDLRHIVTEGVVISSFDDEIDANFRILIIKDKRVTLPVYVDTGELSAPLPKTGARIRVDGFFFRTISSYRAFQHPAVVCERMEVLLPPPEDPFNVPALKGRINLTANDIADLGRCKVEGKVLAVWGGNRLMLKDVRRKIYLARLEEKAAPPHTGDFITLLGAVDSDFFNIKLEEAIWKPAPPLDLGDDDLPEDIVPQDLFHETPDERTTIMVSRQGALVRLTGTLLTLPGQGRDGPRITLDCNRQTISVDISALPDRAAELAIGSKVRVTGRCLLETSKRMSYDIFPQITDFVLIPRDASDLELLECPSWWTPARLVTIIVALLAALLGVVLWNHFLNRLVQRRGQELSQAEVARVCSELRVSERTRLAVELHDTLSQNLTGIALAINAGEYVLAQKSLKSCREELKNCLWDLRNDALEEPEMDTAIYRTLKPHIGSARLLIRFTLARNSLTDNTAHTILRILRELAVNAVRHGSATEIRIAGSIEEHCIGFSVSDNGTGFDPDHVPGMETGHFGLQGIRDRIKQMNGDMKIESSSTTGTKVSIWLRSKC